MMIVISIIMVLAALTIGGYNYAMKGSKRRTTEATMTAVESTLEEYLDKYGEYPEPASTDETYEVRPGKTFTVGGAKCLYQALRGDGFDAIKGGENSAAEGASPQSDGNFTTEEISQVLFKDMPPAMWRKIGESYMIIDAFNNPFQYIKAAVAVGGVAPEPLTINSTYDLWSYADDEQNTTMRSLDTQDSPTSANKWIKNW
ncbi:MAG: hypothetical protein IPK32_18210 [Verrucomicrobiaceae bacterium]|nr:hypothetical protein [Verrucomicrobiaceae bacterium]